MRNGTNRILPVCQLYGKHLPFGNIADTAGLGRKKPIGSLYCVNCGRPGGQLLIAINLSPKLLNASPTDFKREPFQQPMLSNTNKKNEAYQNLISFHSLHYPKANHWNTEFQGEFISLL